MIWQRPQDDRAPETPAAEASSAWPAAAAEGPARGRSIIQTASFMLALFALAFAATTLVVFSDGGLSLEAGLVCVVGVVVFAAVTMTGRGTGP